MTATRYKQELVGIPAPYFAESPSSWITRAAASQVVSPRELADYLGLPFNHDPELAFASPLLNRITGLCGLRRRQFAAAVRIFGRLKRVDADGRRFLLHEGGKPRFRFCPACLRESGKAYFPVHWRFKCWRWCPAHNCLMEDACPSCGAHTVLPRDMLNAGISGIGVGTMARCFTCSGTLIDEQWAACGRIEPRLLTNWELTLLTNGRALLAALNAGCGWMMGDSSKVPLLDLKRLDGLGLLPHERFRLDRRILDRRRVVMLSHSESSSR